MTIPRELHGSLGPSTFETTTFCISLQKSSLPKHLLPKDPFEKIIVNDPPVLPSKASQEVSFFYTRGWSDYKKSSLTCHGITGWISAPENKSLSQDFAKANGLSSHSKNMITNRHLSFLCSQKIAWKNPFQSSILFQETASPTPRDNSRLTAGVRSMTGAESTAFCFWSVSVIPKKITLYIIIHTPPEN